jgi:hypothetical protein
MAVRHRVRRGATARTPHTVEQPGTTVHCTMHWDSLPRAAAAPLAPHTKMLALLLVSSVHGGLALLNSVAVPPADVVVYGSTVCGVTAAVAAANAGAAVTFVVNASRIGGLTSGGLGGRDGGASIIGDGSLADRLWAPLGMNFEPHAAEASCQALLDSAPAGRVTTVRHTGWLKSVATRGPSEPNLPRTIESITLQSGMTVRGQTFIDCSYEGDLLRLSGTRYAVGREARSEYGEYLAGVDGQQHPNGNWSQKDSMFAADVSPWADGTNTTLLPGIVGVQPYSDAQRGEADDWVMSMCFRMCLSNNASNAVPISAPAGYTNLTMELLRRQMASKLAVTKDYTLDEQFLVRYLNKAKSKIDLNSGAFDKSPFSTDLPFLQHDWPLANASGRTRIFEEHKWWTRALLYFLAHDPAVRRMQPAFSAEMRSWGLCKDEFKETQHWPPQLYVRESVRLRGPVVLTQKDVTGKGAASGAGGLGRWNRSVGLSRWGVDIHSVRRVVVKVSGRQYITNAGGHDTMRCKPPQCGPDYPTATVQVPYDALTPQRNDTANLLVPVCISSSHIAFSTYRLEPQYRLRNIVLSMATGILD